MMKFEIFEGKKYSLTSMTKRKFALRTCCIFTYFDNL